MTLEKGIEKLINCGDNHCEFIAEHAQAIAKSLEIDEDKIIEAYLEIEDLKQKDLSDDQIEWIQDFANTIYKKKPITIRR
ncbi:unnamed protein product [marine sediment metagenome]|uniref:Uncharacterized protein n=1 Tax=marine sediment metagenome TaxID=412755 RepID=X0XR44_9ZZZZ